MSVFFQISRNATAEETTIIPKRPHSMPTIPGFRSPRQEDFKFEDGQDHTARLSQETNTQHTQNVKGTQSRTVLEFIEAENGSEER